MQKLLSSMLFAAFAFLTLSAEECGESHYISDSGFDLWCGETLCDWEVSSGAVSRASSWHRADYAVELLGSDVTISQVSTRAASTCIRFEMLADIEDDAQVTLSMDFFDDGVIEYEQELTHVRWESLVHFAGSTGQWPSVRFILHKTGPGRARLAQIEATVASGCVNMPMGTQCQDGSICASGICKTSPVDWYGGVCSGCEGDQDCHGDQVCGAGSKVSNLSQPARECIPEASKALGTLCIGDAECASGVCCGNTCSECCDVDDCGPGDSCDPSPHELVHSDLMPSLCSSNEAGRVCLQDSDCLSGVCSGGDETRICQFDGRDCETSEDCTDLSFGGEPDPNCVAIGIDAGTCQ